MLDKEIQTIEPSVQISHIPNKHTFRIGEVSKILNVKPYILRYWESEFSQLKPRKLDNKQRIYYHRDVETLFLIKKLLYEDGYSIKGAKQALKPLGREFRQMKKSFQIQDRLAEDSKSILVELSELKKLFV